MTVPRSDARRLAIRAAMAERASSPMAAARYLAGYSQVETGFAAGVSRMYVSKLERGAVSPLSICGEWSASVLAIADCLDTDPQSLFPDAVPAAQRFEPTCISEASEAFAACGLRYWASRELVGELAAALGTLTSAQRHVIELRFGLGGDDPMLLREVGDLYGLSRERIRQIEAEALAWLRRRITAD